MKKKQAAEKPDRHKKKGKTKPGLTFVERRRLAELKHMLAGTNKNAEKPTTAQKTITFQKMYRDGICQVTSGFYTKMVEFYDINYDLLENEYNVEIRLENLPYEHIRWIENKEEVDVDALTGTSDMKKVIDMKGNPLLLFVNAWSVGMTLDRNEGLVLSEFSKN